MPWMLIGYMFLFIHRPFEVWPVLGDLRVERVYMACTVLAWAISSGKRWLPNAQHFAYFAFAGAVLVAWVMSPWMERSQPIVEDYFKIVVFYVLLVTTVNDEKSLKKIVAGFIAVMAIYLAHSLKEYQAGRHTYRMGISRMIGVDSTAGDPNSFGASIVFALPFVTCLWRTGVGGRRGRLFLVGYAALSVLCVLLTGSRSSLLGVLFYALILVMGTKKRFRYLALAVAVAPIVFFALPPSLQTRFETIINSDVGPANAKESGEGRIQGFKMGMELWAANPIAGVGPGAWRPATKQPIESHNLYGQLAGELGTLGVAAFLGVVSCFILNARKMAKIKRANPEWANDFPFQVSSAAIIGLALLLFMGNFGHNMFRYSWLWYGGFLIIARHCAEWRLATRYGEEWDDDEFEDEDEADHVYNEWVSPSPPSKPLPPGWEWHAAHPPVGVAE